MKRFEFVAVAGILLSVLLQSAVAQGDLLARWEFPDQGADADRDVSATVTHAGLTATALEPGSGYEWVVNVDGANTNTYINNPVSGTIVLESGGSFSTADEYVAHADWNDGDTGGDINLGSGHDLNPSGATDSGSGALYLSAIAGFRNSLQDILDKNLGLTFSMQSAGQPYVVTNFSFFLSRNPDVVSRTWTTWHLLASPDQTFTRDELIASGTPTTNTTWEQMSAVLNLRVNQNPTYFLLAGECLNTSQGYGRELAIDDIAFQGHEMDDNVLAWWAFDDQGADADSDVSAYTHVEVTASDLMPGSAYGWVVQSNAVPPYTNTYINSPVSGTTVLESGGTYSSPTEYVAHADWADGSLGGGDIDLVPAANAMDPTGTTDSGSGCLYVNASAEDRSNVAEILSNNMGLMFSLQPAGRDFVVTNFSFFVAINSDIYARSWLTWYLLASDDQTFTVDEQIASGDTQRSDYETWSKMSAALDLTVGAGTKYFLLAGTSNQTTHYGREIALDDILFRGYRVPQGTLIVIK